MPVRGGRRAVRVAGRPGRARRDVRGRQSVRRRPRRKPHREHPARAKNVITHPAISIVLPTRNGARFLREAIESCLAQTYSDFELILVDDGSTDATPDIVGDYARRDHRIRTITNRENLRLPRSLNIGFASAVGRYFTWISDDNRFRPRALQTLAAVLDKRPDVDVVYSDYSVIDDAGNAVA